MVTRKGGAWNVPDFYREGEQCWAQWRKQLCALGTEDLWERAAMPCRGLPADGVVLVAGACSGRFAGSLCPALNVSF